MPTSEMTSSDRTLVWLWMAGAMVATVLIVCLTYANTRPKTTQVCPRCQFVFESATPDRAGDR